MAKLTIKDDSGRERAYLLKDAETMAGRASVNPIQINDEKSSRQHFKIERRDDGFYVVDLGSTNGTRLNGTRLGLPVLLVTGDVITVGKTSMTFSTFDTEDPAAVPAAVAAAAIPAAIAAAAVSPIPTAVAPIAPPKPALPPVDPEKVTMVSGDIGAKLAATKSPEKIDGPKYILKVIEGASPGKIYELGRDPLTLGRHVSNTIQVDDEAASNYHAEVSREPIGYVVADLGSTNGTRVKPKEKSDFEKVVKTPLKPGMQIKIGKTLIEFQNIGTPVEEDNLFATSVIDAKKLDAQIEASAAAAYIGGGNTGSSWGLKIAALLVVMLIIGLGAWAIPPLFRPNKPTVITNPTGTEQLKPASNLVANPSFDLEIDDEGYPKEFQVQKGSPEAVISVTPEAERPGEKADPQKHGLQISKGDAKSLFKPTVVESRDPISVDAGKSYELSAWMRNDGDGIYGMRVTWMEGDRSLAEDPIVVKGSQGWGKEARTVTVTPPVWASRARVGVFVQGKSGKACFDELSFKEKSSAAQRAPVVKNNGIVVQFEGSKGAFSATSQGKVILEDGTLRLEATESKAASDLSSAFKAALTKSGDANSAGYEGRLFDFAQQDFANFVIGAKPGASGVDLNASLELPQDTTSKPLMRFFITGNAAQGDIEIAKPDGTVTRLQGTEDKADTGIKSILFNAGKTPQFDLLFGKPASIHLKREGKRRLVEIKFDSDILVSMAPEDVLQKQEMLTAAGDLKKIADSKEWGNVEAKLKAFNEKYAARFPQAQEEAAKIKDSMDAAWKTTQEETARLISSLQTAATPELLDKARQANQRQTESWKDSEKAPHVVEMLAQINAIGEKMLNSDAEKKAEESFVSAQKNYDAGNYEVAVAILQKSILENTALATTKVADKARELLPKATAAFKRQKDVNVIQDNLRAITKNYIAQKNYKEAIRIIETDPEYKSNKADLKEIQAVLEDWRKKAGL